MWFALEEPERKKKRQNRKQKRKENKRKKREKKMAEKNSPENKGAASISFIENARDREYIIVINLHNETDS